MSFKDKQLIHLPQDALEPPAQGVEDRRGSYLGRVGVAKRREKRIEKVLYIGVVVLAQQYLAPVSCLGTRCQRREKGERLRLVGLASFMDGCNEVLYIGANFAKLIWMTCHGFSTPSVPYIGAALTCPFFLGFFVRRTGIRSLYEQEYQV